jgi:tRNA nucleotidyltransferase (CCA-adding enzyme)
MLYRQETQKKDKVSDGAIRRLANRIHPATIYELILLSEADHLGRGPFGDVDNPAQLLLPDAHLSGEWLLKRARTIEVESSKPKDLILGRDLIELGFAPGPNFGKIIRLTNELRDQLNFSREQVLEAIFEKGESEAITSLESLLEGHNGSKV